MMRFVPSAILGVFLVYLTVAMFPPERSRDGFDLAEFGRLPLLMNGRVQPIDSAARLALFEIRGSASVPVEKASLLTSGSLRPTEWLLEVMTKPAVADTRLIFPIRDPALLGTFALKPPAGSGPAYYSFKQLEPRLAVFATQAVEIGKLNASSRNRSQRESLTLRDRLTVYQRLRNSVQPTMFLPHEAGVTPAADDFASSLSRFQIDLRAASQVAAARKQDTSQTLDAATAERIRTYAGPYVAAARGGALAIVPPDLRRSRATWRSIATAVVESTRTGELAPPVSHFASLSSAFAQGKPAIFNAALADYRQWLSANGQARAASTARLQFFANVFRPLIRAIALYLVAFVLACAFWVKRSPVLYRSAAMLVGLAFAVHTAGLLIDMMLEGRPPVTTVYSSIVFAGWAVVILAAAAERFTPNGIGMVVAGLAGLTALAVAHTLTGGGMQLIRTVLDVQFWAAIAAIGIAFLFRVAVSAAPMMRKYVRRRAYPTAPTGVHGYSM